MKIIAATVALGLCAGLAACGEKVQTAGTRKADQAPYATEAGPFTAPGWKAGDATSWERDLAIRAQNGQNEYSRAAAR